MPPIKQYLRVKRLSLRDVFLLFQVDLSDDKPFRPGDVVAACGACRRVSKRVYWQRSGNACPFCGGRDSLPFQTKKDLLRGAQPPVIYTSRGIKVQFPRRVPVKALLLAVLAALLAVLVWPRGYRSQAGFQQTEDGHFIYQDRQGIQYMDGDYSIDGQIYHFENGLLAGEYALKIGNLTKITDENGVLRKGWTIFNKRLQYVDEYGVASNRVPGASGAGFLDLEGLGTVFLTEQQTPGDGWEVYLQRLYHFQNGKPAPVPDLPGVFGPKGEYTPDEAGFVETEYGAYYLDENGLVLRGYVAHRGFVYLMDESTGLRQVLKDNELPGVSVGYAGALIPAEDTIFPCQGGSLIVQARTGAIRTGWALLNGGIYCAGADGYLRCGEPCDDPPGMFDAAGRFLPAQAGPLGMDGLTCYVYADGTQATGCVKEGDFLYLYDEAGALRANDQVANVGVTDAAGALRPYAAGMYEIDGAYYCLNQQGRVLTGWQRIGKLYYFDPVTGRRASAGALVDGVAYPLSRDGAFAPAVEGLYQLGEDSFYVLTDGNLASGWRVVEDQLRYFDEQTGKLREEALETAQPGWLQKNNARFYIRPDGQAARGWQIIDHRVYYFNPQSGAALTGAQQIDGAIYHFREDGALLPDHPLALTIDGASIRIGENGAPQGGFLYRGGHLYYYDPDSAALSVQLPEDVAGWTSAMGGFLIPQGEGTIQAGSASYYLDSAGNVLTGWFTRGELLYYADPGTGILAKNGKSEAWGGAFRDGAFTPEADGVFRADGREYLFLQGKLASGWVLTDSGVGYVTAGSGFAAGTTLSLNGLPYKFSPDGRYVPGVNRLMQVQGKTVYLLADGSLPGQAGIYPLSLDAAFAWSADQEGAVALPRTDADRRPYPAGGYLVACLAGGQVASSAQEAGLSSSSFTLRSGVVVPVSTGLQTIGENTYLLMADGAFAADVCTYGRHLYRFDPVTGVMMKNSQGFGPDGYYISDAKGICFLGDDAYWIEDPYGTLGIGWLEDEYGNVRYADENGRLAMGLTVIDGDRYYFLGESADWVMARNRFIASADADGGRYEYFAGEDGKLAVGWQEVFGVLHYFDEEGRMLYDTVKDGRYINIYGEVI